jgi:hypothetical protein
LGSTIDADGLYTAGDTPGTDIVIVTDGENNAICAWAEVTVVIGCGNGVIDTPEVCDGTNLGDATCISQEFDGGTLACAADCLSFDTSGCFNFGQASYKAGAATMNLGVGACATRTVSLDGSTFGPSPLVSGGFLLQNTDDTKADVTTCRCYDGTLTPAVWDAGIEPVFDPTGYQGGVFVAAANLGAGVTPSANILVCDIQICGVAAGIATISIDTVPDFETWVAQDFTTYDPNISAAVINVTVSSAVTTTSSTRPSTTTSTPTTTTTVGPTTTTTTSIGPTTTTTTAGPTASIKVTPSSVFQSRWFFLPAWLRIEGTNTNFVRRQTAVTFKPANAIMKFPPFVLDSDTILMWVVIMPQWLTGELDNVAVTAITGSESAPGNLEIKLLPFFLEEQN